MIIPENHAGILLEILALLLSEVQAKTSPKMPTGAQTENSSELSPNISIGFLQIFSGMSSKDNS